MDLNGCHSTLNSITMETPDDFDPFESNDADYTNFAELDYFPPAGSDEHLLQASPNEMIKLPPIQSLVDRNYGDTVPFVTPTYQMEEPMEMTPWTTPSGHPPRIATPIDHAELSSSVSLSSERSSIVSEPYQINHQLDVEAYLVRVNISKQINVQLVPADKSSKCAQKVVFNLQSVPSSHAQTEHQHQHHQQQQQQPKVANGSAERMPMVGEAESATIREEFENFVKISKTNSSLNRGRSIQMFCHYCEKWFSSIHKATNHEHLRYLDDQQAWHCSACKFEFSSPRCLRTHQIQRHIRGPNVFHCRWCSFKCRVAKKLKKHLHSRHKIVDAKLG